VGRATHVGAMEKKKHTHRPKAKPAVQPLERRPDGPPSSDHGHLEAPSPDAEASAGENADSDKDKDFPIVGIGASAGGLAAFEAFFSGLPADSDPGMAFVLVQHLAPDHKSILTDLIRRYTRLKVFEVEDGMVVRPNCAYIIPPGRDMACLGGALSLLEPSAPRGQRLPIDFFFRSLAQDQGEKAIGVVLSGTGGDGSLGVRAIKGEGGMVMAQSPSTTEYDGMPRSAIDTGAVDYVLRPDEMASQIIGYVGHSTGRIPRPPGPPKAESALRKIFILLRAQTGHDFSHYKSNTINRRIERRMAVHQIETLGAYAGFMQQNPAEVQALFRDLLIGVTSFFRDPDAFKALEEQVIPKLFANKPAESAIRVWSIGCATGEEAYSLAMLLAERQEALKRSFRIQVFGTDIDAQAIASARTGIYPASISADVPPERLARFFTAEPDGVSYRIHKSIRDLLIFSEQDVIKDPPFSKIDLIGCRNLLIYMDSELQKKLIPLLHYALNPDGFLFLGTSETVSEYGELFATVNRQMKLYQRKEDLHGAQRAALGRFAPPILSVEAGEPTTGKQAQPRRSLREVTEHALLQQVAPAAALVTANGDILYLHGRTGMYLEPAPGETGVSNVLKMAREGLRRDLTGALHGASITREIVRCPNLQVKTNGGITATNLTIRPVTAAGSPEKPLFLVVLERAHPPGQEPEVSPPDAAGAASPATDTDARIAALQQELRAKEQYLQTTNEELESTNEELKSSNEEMQSVNEELQSTNEELETSKEELQSVNEELFTVNTELQNKVGDLTRANNDMNNLLAGTGIATVFVDHSLHILRFTPAATRIINLIPSDVGRPVGHLVANLEGYDRLSADTQSVLDTLVPKEMEVQAKGGVWYAMRILPYRTLDNVIEGAVITFVDVNSLKQAQESLRQSERKFSILFEKAAFGAALATLPDRKIIQVNESFERMLGYARNEVTGKTYADLGLNLEPDPRKLQASELRQQGSVAAAEIKARIESGEERAFLVSMDVIEIESRKHVLCVMQDITERRKSEDALRESQATLARELDTAAKLHRLAMLSVREADLSVILGEVVEAAISVSAADFGNIQLLDKESSDLHIVGQRGFPQWWIDFWNTTAKGKGSCGTALERRERVIVEDVEKSPIFAGARALEIQLRAGVRAVQSTPLIGRSGTPLGVFSTHYQKPQSPDERALRLLDLLARQATDIIERAQMEASLRESEERFRALVIATSDVVYCMSPDWSEMRLLYGRDFIPDTQEPSRVWLEKYIHADDQPRMMAAIDNAIAIKGVFELEHRMVRRNGTLGWVFSRAVPILNAGGEIIEWFGTAKDITALKEAEEVSN
jgi:two-component system, chemotaxis family, CheB/CheR fusion protein